MQTHFRGPASFYLDPSQHILALSLGYYVMEIEALLRFAMEQAGEEVQWEEWKPWLIEVFPHGTPDAAFHLGCWVSGFDFYPPPSRWAIVGTVYACTILVCMRARSSSTFQATAVQ